MACVFQKAVAASACISAACSAAAAFAQDAQLRAVALAEWRWEDVLAAAGALRGRSPLPIDPPGGGWALRHRRADLVQVPLDTSRLRSALWDLTLLNGSQTSGVCRTRGGNALQTRTSEHRSLLTQLPVNRTGRRGRG